MTIADRAGPAAVTEVHPGGPSGSGPCETTRCSLGRGDVADARIGRIRELRPICPPNLSATAGTRGDRTWQVGAFGKPAPLLPDADFASLPWGDDPDPLRTGIERLLACTSGAGGHDGLEMGVILTVALDAWVRRMAELYNEGHRFSHPAPCHGWPSPLYDTSAAPDDW